MSKLRSQKKILLKYLYASMSTKVSFTNSKQIRVGPHLAALSSACGAKFKALLIRAGCKVGDGYFGPLFSHFSSLRRTDAVTLT